MLLKDVTVDDLDWAERAYPAEGIVCAEEDNRLVDLIPESVFGKHVLDQYIHTQAQAFVVGIRVGLLLASRYDEAAEKKLNRKLT